MEKKLTPTEKLYIVREVRKEYLRGIKEGSFANLCYRFGEVMRIKGIVRWSWNCDTVYELIPEFVDYKPSHKRLGELWWPLRETEPRLYVLGRLEERYYDETTV